MSLHKYKPHRLYDKHVGQLSNEDIKQEIKNVEESTKKVATTKKPKNEQ